MSIFRRTQYNLDALAFRSGEAFDFHFPLVNIKGISHFVKFVEHLNGAQILYRTRTLTP